MTENKIFAVPTSLKSLIDYQIMRGELPDLLGKNKPSDYDWDIIEEQVLASINLKEATFKKQSTDRSLDKHIFWLRLFKKKVDNVLITYEQNNSVGVDLVEISFPLSHPVFNYKSMKNNFNLKRLPIMLFYPGGNLYRIQESVGRVTFSGLNTLVIPLSPTTSS